MKRTLLVVGSLKTELHALVPFAHAIAVVEEYRIVLLGLIPVAPAQSLSTGALQARELRQGLAASARRVDARVMVCVAHDIGIELKKVVADENPALVLLDRNRLPSQDVLRTLACEQVLVKPPYPGNRPRILLPIRGGPFAARALRLALAIADHRRGEITVLQAAPRTERKAERLQQMLAHLRELPQVTRWIEARGDAAQAIIAAAREHDCIIMGAIAVPRPGEPAIGPTATRVLDQVGIPALVVRAEPVKSRNGEPKTPPVDHTISVVVDKWFAENTFHAHEFENLQDLVRLKERQGLTISLGLPALNEEKTIGRIIQTIRRRFIEDYALLDEIVVIDSDSTDRTVEIATGLGVRVERHSQILKSYGRRKGKGEALWKSLHVLRGDLIAWIDTDIVNIHPRFVYGILGPLIREPELLYVKGFYQRPLRIGRRLEARGGGRVTELVARPLLNLFYPQLSGFVQPLSGEYAGRRRALESVPFLTGYGVEIGLLIDLWQCYGLSAIGQVDLEERVHRNQSLLALSKMAFEITQVVMQRVGAARGVELVDELNKSMKLIRYTRNEFQLDVADIRAAQRPAMLTIPEYRQQHECA